jgi:hypothetical protein
MHDVAPLSCPYTSPNHGEHVVELVNSLISLQFLCDTLLLIAALLLGIFCFDVHGMKLKLL